MKRLLVLMLVLGMASVANGVLIQVDGQGPGQTLDIAEGITSVISVVSEVAGVSVMSLQWQWGREVFLLLLPSGSSFR